MIINVGYITRKTSETIRKALTDYGIRFEDENELSIKEAFETLRKYRENGEKSKVYRLKIIVEEVVAKRAN